MRPPSDLPRPAPGGRSRGRIALIAFGAIFFLVVVFGRGVAGFYLDYLWHDGLGRTDVFWGQLVPKLTLFGIFFGFFVALPCLITLSPTNGYSSRRFTLRSSSCDTSTQRLDGN